MLLGLETPVRERLTRIGTILYFLRFIPLGNRLYSLTAISNNRFLFHLQIYYISNSWIISSIFYNLYLFFISFPEIGTYDEII